MNLVTEKELAKILKVSAYTLAELRKKQNGPPYFMLGGSVRYILEDVKAWIQDQMYKGEDRWKDC